MYRPEKFFQLEPAPTRSFSHVFEKGRFLDCPSCCQLFLSLLNKLLQLIPVEISDVR